MKTGTEHAVYIRIHEHDGIHGFLAVTTGGSTFVPVDDIPAEVDMWLTILEKRYGKSNRAS